MAKAVELAGSTVAYNQNAAVTTAVGFSRTDTTSVAAAAGNSQDSLNATSGGARMFVNLTAISGASATITFALWDSADNSSFAAVTGAATSGLTAIGTATVTVPAGQAVRRYVAIATTVTGTTPSATFTVTVDKDTVARITTTDHAAKAFGPGEL